MPLDGIKEYISNAIADIRDGFVNEIHMFVFKKPQNQNETNEKIQKLLSNYKEDLLKNLKLEVLDYDEVDNFKIDKI